MPVAQRNHRDRRSGCIHFPRLGGASAEAAIFRSAAHKIRKPGSFKRAPFRKVYEIRKEKFEREMRAVEISIGDFENCGGRAILDCGRRRFSNEREPAAASREACRESHGSISRLSRGAGEELTSVTRNFAGNPRHARITNQGFRCKMGRRRRRRPERRSVAIKVSIGRDDDDDDADWRQRRRRGAEHALARRDRRPARRSRKNPRVRPRNVKYSKSGRE